MSARSKRQRVAEGLSRIERLVGELKGEGFIVNGQLTLGLPDESPRPEPAEEQAQQTHNTNGDLCDRCAQPTLVPAGGGCLRCVNCGYEPGCGQ